jgi:hypothetical protein
MWSVPHESVDAVRKAAARYGVVVDQLGDDWNLVFRAALPPTRLRELIARVMSSKATVSVGVMLPMRAARVEYALTKDALGRGQPNEPAKIKLQLNEKRILTVARTSVDVGPDSYTWHGTVEGTDGPVTIMWWPHLATMAGTVAHQGLIYSIRRVRGETHTVAVVEMSEARMPPEHAPTPVRLRANDSKLQDDPLVKLGDATVLRRVITGVGSSRSTHREVTPERKSTEGPSEKDIAINVIVAYTKQAARIYADVRRELVDLAIEQANQSFRNSNLGHVKLNLVYAYQTEYSEEGDHFDHLWRFADKGDGYMDEIHDLRDTYDADIAVLIVEDSKGCGLSTRVFAEADEAFSVVNHDCAIMNYSVAHEIGHLIGARHELALDSTMTPFPYGHGYVNGTKWRDVMSYKESCGGCPRMPIWSSPNLTIRGDLAGTANEDNARVIAEHAARITYFRASRRSQLLSSAPVPDSSQARAADQSH